MEGGLLISTQTGFNSKNGTLVRNAKFLPPHPGTRKQKHTLYLQSLVPQVNNAFGELEHMQGRKP